MYIMEMILMTKSSKYGEYCVAGIECETGRWIRLVSDNEQTNGALSSKMLYDAARRRCADILDRVRVEIKERCSGRVQTENVLVDGAGRIRILERVTLEEAMRICPCESRNALFESHHHIVQVDVETLGHSLEFVQARNVRIYTMIGSSGKPKYKIDFECEGQAYTQFSMTDPDYYDRREHRIDRAALVLSISDNEWSRANGHYIYAAKIFDIERYEKAASRRTRRRAMSESRTGAAAALIAAALVMLTAAGIAFAQMPKAYVPPYSGARYHLDARCERMSNPAAAYRLPELLAKLLCAPCSECAAEAE